MTAPVRPFPRLASSADLDAHGLVLVPERLARVIRSALDRSERDIPGGGHDKLAEQLIACEGYRLDKEPWAP